MPQKSVPTIPSSSNILSLFLKDSDTPAAPFLPIRLHNDITMQQLAEEFCVTSVLECDASGCVPARAVALDSPRDILHCGKYYIARRDVQLVRRSPRVTFRGKIVVEEFDTEHAVIEQQQQKKENNVIASATVTSPLVHNNNNNNNNNNITVLNRLDTRKRRYCESDNDDNNNNNIEEEPEDDENVENNNNNNESKEENNEDNFVNINAKTHTFVPFVGDLYDDGREELIHLKDVRRFCENVNSDEAEFNARHLRAEKFLKEAKQTLLQLSNSNNNNNNNEN